MEIHVFAEKLRSYKELAVHYVLIVLGILTAIGLEQCIESRHHAQQAAAAEKAIVAELRGNLKTVSRSIEEQRKSLAVLKAAEARLGDKTFAVPDLEVRAQAVLSDWEKSDENLTIELLSLRRTEWDSAIASQTLQHMDRVKVVAFTKAYTAMQTIASTVGAVVANSRTLDHSNAIDMYSRGESKDALRFARSIKEFHDTKRWVNDVNVRLADTLRETLGEPAPAPATSAASR